MLWRKLYALRRHQAGKWVMRLRQMRMHMLEHLVGGMWPGDRQHPWMRGADNILLRPQTTRNNYLAVFRQRLTDSVERFLNRRVDEAAGINDDQIGAFVGRRNQVALGTQLGKNLLGINQRLRAAQADKTHR